MSANTKKPRPSTSAARKIPAAKVSAKLPKIGFVSLGCPKNLVDSEVMMGLLHSSGATITPRAEDADVIVVNTCSFIESAKQESVDTILEMARYKTEGRAKKLIVAGCLVERYRDEIQAQIPEVDAVVGTDEITKILEAAGLALPKKSSAANPLLPILNQGSLSQKQKSGQPATMPQRAEAAISEKAGRFSRQEWAGAKAALPTYLYNEKTPRVLATGSGSAYIKIAEGCDHPCTFCIIPQLRGKFRSRSIASVVSEARQLASQGVREITLIGQDTTCYGEDLGLKDGLAALLEALAGIEELRWIRFLYSYPNKITTKLLETIAAHGNICSYIDVPLQHASASVLKRMKRGGGSEAFLRLIARMRRLIPGVTIRTSIIVGFPGETEEEFAELCRFLEVAEIDWLGAFAYSDEEGTPAYRLPGKLPKKIIEQRRRKLMAIQKKISRRKRKQMAGQIVEVMLEGPSEQTEMLWEARTQAHAPEIDGKLYINDFGEDSKGRERKRVRAGEFYQAEIVETHDYDLVARLL
jgi:ribosomal protein S12 methylthiotransferase